MKTKKIIIITVVAVLLIYLIESLSLSIVTLKIVNSSYDNYGESNNYSAIVNDDTFTQICFRQHLNVSAFDFEEDKTVSFPITLHWFFGGRIFYWYSYEVNNGHVTGSWNIPASLSFNVGFDGIKVYDYNETP